MSQHDDMIAMQVPCIIFDASKLMSVQNVSGNSYHKDISDSLDEGGNILYDLENDPVYEPYFMIKKLKVSVDEKDSSIVHYSCKIPGLVGAAFNMVYQRCFLLNDAYSKPVEVEGDLTAV